MKAEWQWPAAIVFIVVFVVMGGLVWSGKMPSETLLTLFIGGMLPAPMQLSKKGTPSTSPPPP